ncbi:MAG: biotin transporter BioY [Acutalibacteraceae bacterium]|nr:biotin transporter BioY [Acutalibacteraceae bacterium]
MKPQKIAITGILAAIICLVAPFSISLGAIPISLATFVIYIAACIVDVKISVCSVAIYILLGTCGLPVFSHFNGGFHMISGITGGYIIGYIPCVLITGLLIKKFGNKKYMYPVSMILGTVVCYIFGTAWYILQTQNNIASAITVCVLPFLIGDAIKISAASTIGITLRKRLIRFTK